MVTVILGDRDDEVPEKFNIGDRPDYTGGEGNVYFSCDGKYVVKIYHKESPEKRKLLESIVFLGERLAEGRQFLAWPVGVVEKVNSTPKLGVVTARFPSSYEPIYRFVYTPKDAAKYWEQGASWVDHVKIARGIASGLADIHEVGAAHGDISLKNILADVRNGGVVLIDMDGLIVPGFLKPQVKGTPRFMAPEIVMGKAEPSELTDRHSLAVVLLWVLLLRNVMLPKTCYDEDQARDEQLAYGEYALFSEHPNDRRNWDDRIGQPLYQGGALSYKVLTPELQSLTEQALIDGLRDPERRPEAKRWRDALGRAYDALVPCLNCRQSAFYQYWLPSRAERTCPFCGQRFGSKLREPNVLALYEPDGTAEPARHLVLYDNLPLFLDVAEPRSVPPYSRKDTPKIAVVRWNENKGCRELVNESKEPWTVCNSGQEEIKPAESVPLRPGLRLQLGPGKRIIEVLE